MLVFSVFFLLFSEVLSQTCSRVSSWQCTYSKTNCGYASSGKECLCDLDIDSNEVCWEAIDCTYKGCHSSSDCDQNEVCVQTCCEPTTSYYCIPKCDTYYNGITPSPTSNTWPDCDDSYSCAYSSYSCYDYNCNINCKNTNACYSSSFNCSGYYSTCNINCNNDYSCQYMDITVKHNAVTYLYCTDAYSPCNYQTWRIYGKAYIYCYNTGDCDYMNFYVYDGGYLYLYHADDGYYNYADIYLYDGSNSTFDYYWSQNVYYPGDSNGHSHNNSKSDKAWIGWMAVGIGICFLCTVSYIIRRCRRAHKHHNSYHSLAHDHPKVCTESHQVTIQQNVRIQQQPIQPFQPVQPMQHEQPFQPVQPIQPMQQPMMYPQTGVITAPGYVQNQPTAPPLYSTEGQVNAPGTNNYNV